MITKAFWISPGFDIYEVKDKHINFVRTNLDLFKLSIDEYNSFFEKYNEPFGLEGKARQEMFLSFFKSGWIRVRENLNLAWVIELWELTVEIDNFLKGFIQNINSNPEKTN